MIEAIAVCRLAGCLVALGIAGYLAFEGKEGWGWFLFVAVCLGYFEVEVKK